MSEQLKNKIKDWLDKHGYPLEMYVASVFQKAGFEVVQSVYYTDPESNTAREVDVFAYKNIQFDNHWLSFSFVIECKSSKKPWLAFMADDNTKEFNSSNFHSTRTAKTLINTLRKNTGFKSDLFPYELKHFAYALTQALRDGDTPDITYKAVQTITKSIESYISRYDSKPEAKLYYYFPLIVTDCPLFEVKLQNDNTIDIQETLHSIYLARNPKDNNLTSAVQILNKEVIGDYAMTCYNNIKEIEQTYKSEILSFLTNVH